ncbi:hypothetical protein [Ruegeria sp. Ofav3-42]|uniref:hypothetical protein n=1 Tax=Ruegeria sp. Ofav3-42 TaxID=2917759 RepID=UPI001EF74E7F|nr:hypothetical protein [Ruegeria sp. Ofav3-42]MCG7522052.1 hypothetical protein [Ruegeria sp. Ofav3-42]
MFLRYIRNLVSGLIVAAVAGLGPAVADEIDDAKSVVEKFYAAYIANDSATLAGLFFPSATGQYRTIIGYGIPDSVTKFTATDAGGLGDAEIPEEYQQYMQDYKEFDHVYKIRSAKKSEENVRVEGRLTSKYTTSDYRGKNIQDDVFIITSQNGEPLILRYEGTGRFK